MKLRSISLLLIMGLISPNTNPAGEIGELPNENQVPRLVSMNFYKDAKTEMAFRWNTSYWTDSDLEMVLASEGDFTSDKVLHFEGECQRSEVANDGFIHSVVASGLTPNETYLYRVGDKELDAWSKEGICKTENDSASTRFVHISDPQVSEESHAKGYQETLKAIDQKEPDFICLTGDMVNSSYEGNTPSLEQWEWALTYQDNLLNYPVMAVAGNHEAASNDFVSRYNLPYAEGQDLSTGGYYSFDYHNIHFVGLNTNDSSSDVDNPSGLSKTQIEWLKEDLTNASKAKWKIIMMHKGIFDAGGHSSNLEGADSDIALIRAQLAPIFSKYGVDLVLQGHDHLYSRSYPIVASEKNGAFYPLVNEDIKSEDEISYLNPSGPIYVNTGSASGSKIYSVVNYDKEMIPLEKAYGSNHKMFTYYEVDEDSLKAEVYEVINGETVIHDSFGIIKTKENNHALKSISSLVILIVASGIVLAIGIVLLNIILKRRKGEING